MKLEQIVYLAAARIGKDENDEYLAMIEELIHPQRLLLLKQTIDRHGFLPWMMQTIEFKLNEITDPVDNTLCKMTDIIPRTMRQNDGTVGDVFTKSRRSILQISETEDDEFSSLNPPIFRVFLRNEKLIFRGDDNIDSILIRAVWADPRIDPSVTLGGLSDYPIHEDLIDTLISMTLNALNPHADIPRDMAEIQRDTGN